jgi:hypothetical protein
MSSSGQHPRAWLVAAACVRAVCQRLVSVRGFQREVAVWTCEQQRRETRLQLQARYSHLVADGPWCTGTAQATDADTRYSLTPLTTREVPRSRSSIPAQQRDLTVTVGWEHPLMTFFALVFDPSIEDDEAACLL